MDVELENEFTTKHKNLPENWSWKGLCLTEHVTRMTQSNVHQIDFVRNA